MFTPYRIAPIPFRKLYRIGLSFTLETNISAWFLYRIAIKTQRFQKWYNMYRIAFKTKRYATICSVNTKKSCSNINFQQTLGSYRFDFYDGMKPIWHGVNTWKIVIQRLKTICVYIKTKIEAFRCESYPVWCRHGLRCNCRLDL